MGVSTYLDNYRTYLTEEKHSSENTVASYVRDVTQFKVYLKENGMDLKRAKTEHVQDYVLMMKRKGKSAEEIAKECNLSIVEVEEILKE